MSDLEQSRKVGHDTKHDEVDESVDAGAADSDADSTAAAASTNLDVVFTMINRKFTIFKLIKNNRHYCCCCCSYVVSNRQ